MSSARLHFRPATRRDLPQIGVVECRCFPEHPYTLSQFRHYFRASNSIFLVAERDGTIAGYVAGVADRRFRPVTARLDSLAVLPEWRRKGTGSALLAEFENAAAARGCRAFVLQVSVRNCGAQRLYENSGYSRGPLLPDYYDLGHDAIQMLKREVT